MNAWSHLPNAAHIDRVLESSKSHPDVWDAAYEAARGAAYEAARNAATWYSILALITYDDSAKYLDMTVDQLKMWAILSEEPAALLLLPAAIAYEKISELETA